MPWWGWMIVGALLLGSELLIVDAGFYLVFIGIAAAITGLVELAGLGLEPWVQWILFSVIALIFMVMFRKKLYAKLRGSGVGYETSHSAGRFDSPTGQGPFVITAVRRAPVGFGVPHHKQGPHESTSTEASTDDS